MNKKRKSVPPVPLRTDLKTGRTPVDDQWDAKIGVLIEQDKKKVDEFLKACEEFEELIKDSTIMFEYVEHKAPGRVVIHKVEPDENDSHLKAEVSIWLPKWWST